MAPSFLFFVFALGLLCWVVLPACLLVTAVRYARSGGGDPLWVRQCRAADPADPAAPGCWVPLDEYCPRHDLPDRRLPPGAGRERSAA